MENTQTWSQDDLEHLARVHRNREIIQGIVQSVGFLNMPVDQGNGSFKTEETEVAIFRLEGDVKAYCPANEFSERSFKTLNGFVGTQQNIIISRLDIRNQIAIVSVKQADQQNRESFWNTIEYLEKKEALQDEVFEGVVYGINPEKETIHVRVNGTDCFMLRQHWDWNRNTDVTAIVDRGETINVKVLRFDKERNMIQVSRRDTMEDPFKALDQMKAMEVVVGRVSGVDPIHGLFVQLEQGVVLKASKPRHLEEPIVGEIVSCRILSIDAKNRRGKVIIVGYPQGKKKRKDLGSFLFG